MLYKIAINNTLHIPFLRKYFGFLFFNALPLPPPGSSGVGAKPLQEGAKSQGGALPHLPPPVCPPLCRTHRPKGKWNFRPFYEIITDQLTDRSTD